MAKLLTAFFISRDRRKLISARLYLALFFFFCPKHSNVYWGILRKYTLGMRNWPIVCWFSAVWLLVSRSYRCVVNWLALSGNLWFIVISVVQAARRYVEEYGAGEFDIETVEYEVHDQFSVFHLIEPHLANPPTFEKHQLFQMDSKLVKEIIERYTMNPIKLMCHASWLTMLSLISSDITVFLMFLWENWWESDPTIKLEIHLKISLKE